MQHSDVRKSPSFHALDQHLKATGSKLNERWSITDLNELRDSVSELIQQLKEAEGEKEMSILTSLVDCDLMQKKIIHNMLGELASELGRVHFQGHDFADYMAEVNHPFASQYLESMVGYVLNRRHLERAIGELTWVW